MSTQVSTGNIIHFLTGCPCGRAWETEQPLHQIPDHVHNHQINYGTYKAGGVAAHTCTGCTWTVETYTPLNDPATGEAVRTAFAKHLLATALEATA